MANARLQIIIDGDNEDAKEALAQIGKALGDLDKTTESSSKTQKSFWDNLTAVAAGGVIANGIAAIAGGIGELVNQMMDVSAAASDARTILGSLADDVDMTSLLNDATLLSTRFGVDTVETVNAAKTLMTEFGISSDEAMNLIISGMEGGLNASGDFLDSIGEYSNLMSDNGFRAEQFFSIMETGMAGGALGTDKAADAFKEFGIRIQAMGDDIFGPEGVLRTSMNMTDAEIAALYQGMQDGTITVAQAYGRLIPKLRAIDSPIQRNAAGVALFGTQWEDLGETAVLSIDPINTSLEDMQREAARSRNSIASLGEIGPLIFGRIANALLPVNDSLLAMINALMNGEDAVAAMVKVFRDAGWDAVASAVQKVAVVLVPMLEWIVDNKEGIVAAILTIATTLTVAAIPSMIASLTALATAGWAALAPLAPLLIAAVALGAVAFVIVENWDSLVGTFKLMARGFDLIGKAFVDLGKTISNFIDNALGGIVDTFEGMGETMYSWITDSISGVKRALNDWWRAITTWFAQLPGNIRQTMLSLGQSIMDGITQGIKNSVTAMTQGISRAIGEAVALIKRLLGIRSPSAVFRDEIGAQMGAGMAQGLADSMGKVRAAGFAVSAAALGGASAATMGTAVNNYYNYSPVYSATPSRPSDDFALMQSLARTL